MKKELLIFIPTYNERGNVKSLYDQISALKLESDILFLDDNSPDGTGDVLDRLAAQDNRLKVVHRSGKHGIGTAHKAGIKWAYEKGYRKILTMDCDFTHSPDNITEFIKYSNDYDVIIGSRYLAKDSLIGWTPYRKMLTNLGNLLTIIFLGMPYDATGAYRLYRLDRIPENFLNLIESKGYSFMFESLHILHLNKISIKEIPTVLTARFDGSSKMQTKDIVESIYHLFRIYFTKLFHRQRLIISD